MSIRADQKNLHVLLFEKPRLLKFQTLLIYMTHGSRVQSNDLTHTHKRSTAAALQDGNPFWKLVFGGLESLCFSWTKKVSPANILQQLTQVYDSGGMSRQQFANWYCTFASSEHDKWQSKYTSKYLKDRCQHFRHRGTQMDRHVNLLCMAFDIVLTYETVQHIKADVLQYCNISAKWAGALNDDNRATRMMACLSFLQC